MNELPLWWWLLWIICCVCRLLVWFHICTMWYLCAAAFQRQTTVPPPPTLIMMTSTLLTAGFCFLAATAENSFCWHPAYRKFLMCYCMSSGSSEPLFHPPPNIMLMLPEWELFPSSFSQGHILYYFFQTTADSMSNNFNSPTQLNPDQKHHYDYCFPQLL